MLKLTLALTLVLADSLLAQQPATAASSLPQTPPVSTRYTVLLAGNTAGFQATSVTPDGAHLYHFEFNDRGRGPGIDSRIVLNRQAIPTQIDNTGHDYLKAPVDEHFSFSGGKANWKNSAEQGTKPLSTAAFYVSDSGAPEELALLARALLLAPGGKLPLLPGGEAAITRRGDLMLEAGGRSLTVVQYGIDGLGLSPTPVWLEPDGAFFAALSGWWVIIREGWESTIPALTKAQDDFTNARAATLAKTLARKPAGALVFVHANLFDAETATLLPRRTVTIKGNSIAAVGEDGKVAIPTGAEVIDATGKTLMPGLWDMHVHLAENDGLLHMAAGVTSVPDGMDQHYSDSFLQMLKMTRALYLAGIPIVAGTDGLAGFTLDRELELYVEAGIPAPKVLQLSTLGAARVMKMDQRLGSIAPARLADVILVDGNPASRISDIRCVETVVKDGVMYRSADLYHAANVASGNPPAN